MSGVIRPIDHRKKNCVVMSSQCVIWDGPDIPCINLCHGDSVEKVIYELAQELCRLLDLLNVSTLDLSCFFENGCGPTDVNQLLQFILNKLCELNGEIDVLQQEPTTFNCELLANCSVNVSCDSEPNLLPIYHPTQQNALTYFASRICEILEEIGNIQNQITTINTTLTNLQNQINVINTTLSGSVFPAYAIPGCSNLTVLGSGGSYPVNTPTPLINYVNAIGTQFCCLIADVFGTTISDLCVYVPNIQQSPCSVLGLDSVTFTNILDALVNIYSTVLPAICNTLGTINEGFQNCCQGCAQLDSYQPLFVVSRVIRDGNTNALPVANQGIYSYQWINSAEVPSGFTVTSLNINYRVLSGNPSVTVFSFSGIPLSTLNYFTVNCPNFNADSQFSTVSGINKYTHESKVFFVFEQQLTNGTVTCTKRYTIELDCPACSCGYVESVFATETSWPALRNDRY